jgi:uncharacterized RDD family membrane protein YckC
VVRTAGAVRRGLAFLIDEAIVGAVWLIGALWLLIVGLLAADAPLALSALALVAAAVAGLGVLLHAVYFVGFVGGGGQTPGKMLLGVRVVRRDGGGVGGARALGRWIGYGLVFATLGLGWIVALFDAERRGVHDRIAGTRVVRDDV